MVELSKKQKDVRDFIASEMNAGRPCPSHREIALRFGFSSSYAAACHIRALIKKGLLVADSGKARSLRLAEAHKLILQPLIFSIPVFGSIPAGFAQEREQESEGCITVDMATIGFKPTRNTFALRVNGDSMIGKHICPEDIVILEHGAEARNGDVVAALIDGKTTLKTFMIKRGKPFLKAENPKYPEIIPSDELVIQGVFRSLIRHAKG
ncbi:MAG: transcriptional repressor LexA [Verrucomicrobiales bacterium]